MMDIHTAATLSPTKEIELEIRTITAHATNADVGLISNSFGHMEMMYCEPSVVLLYVASASPAVPMTPIADTAARAISIIRTTSSFETSLADFAARSSSIESNSEKSTVGSDLLIVDDGAIEIEADYGEV